MWEINTIFGINTTRFLWQDHIVTKQMKSRLNFPSPAWETRSSGVQQWRNRTRTSGPCVWTHLPMLPLANTLCFYVPPNPPISWATSPSSLIPGAEVGGQKKKGKLGSVTSQKILRSSGTASMEGGWGWLTQCSLPLLPCSSQHFRRDAGAHKAQSFLPHHFCPFPGVLHCQSPVLLLREKCLMKCFL